jgi:hypothetical protein
MKRHLTERELIEYQFELVSDVRMEEIVGHLRGCAQCQSRLEQLKRKFAALELLREELEPSEDLISRVLAGTSRPIPTKVVSFRRPAWIGAAAAVLLMAGLLVVSRLGTDQMKTRRPIKESIAVDTEVPTQLPITLALTPEKPKKKAVAADVFEKPPFAPASAIELVVLPRRENVQLTIYNSTFQTLSADYGYGRSSYGEGGAYSTGRYGGYYGGYYGGEPRDWALAESATSGDRDTDERARKQLEKRRKQIEMLRRRLDESADQDLDERKRRRIEQTLKKLLEQSAAEEAAQEQRRAQEAAQRQRRRAMSSGRVERAGPYPHQISTSGAVAGGDLTLVRERRNLTLKKGWNWLQFMWANTLIDPTSLNLEPLKQKDKIEVQQLVFPARLRELGRWLIRSEINGQVPFEITYYMGTLAQDEKTMRLQGYVNVTNSSGEDYENAQTRLVVGKVHILDKIIELAKRQYPYGSPVVVHRGLGYGGFGGADFYDMNGDKVPLLGDVPVMGRLFRHREGRRKEIIKEGLSEYFLYTIEGEETIPDKWGKRLLSLEAEDIDVNSLYKYDEQRWGRETIRFVAFTNDEEHNLGQTPIPDGGVKIYRHADTQDHLSYVGGTNIKYIPVDEEIELNLGPARLVSVEPTLMDFKTDNYMFGANGNITGWDEIRTWKMELTNARELEVEIEITRGFATPYWTLQYDNEGVSYEKHDVERARFKASVQPRTKRKFDYTVTNYHGTRQEQFDQ